MHVSGAHDPDANTTVNIDGAITVQGITGLQTSLDDINAALTGGGEISLTNSTITDILGALTTANAPIVSGISTTNTSLTSALTDLTNILLELDRMATDGEGVALTPATIAALQTVTATILAFPTDYPNASADASLSAILAGMSLNTTANSSINSTLTAIDSSITSASTTAHTDANSVLAALAIIDAAQTNGNQKTQVTNFPAVQTVAGSVTINNSVTVQNFPTNYPDSAAEASLVTIAAALSQQTVVNNAITSHLASMDTNYDISGNKEVNLAAAAITLNTKVTNFPATQVVSGAITINNSITVQGGFTEQASLSAGSLNADLVPSTDISAYRSFSLTVQGTWSGTLTFQASNDGSTWFTYNCFVQSGSSTSPFAAAFATNGTFEGPLAYRYLRLRTTSYTSGTATGTLELYTLPYTARSFGVVVVGNVGSGSGDSGTPVKIGTVFNTTQPTVTNAQRVDAQGTARGAQIVATGVDAFVAQVSDGTNTAQVTADANGKKALTVAELSNLVTITTAGASDTVIDCTNFRSGSLQVVSLGSTISLIVQVSNDNATWIQVPTTPAAGTASPVPSLSAVTTANAYEFRTALKYARIHVTAQTGAAPVIVVASKTQDANIPASATLPVAATQAGTWTVAQGAASGLPWPVQIKGTPTHISTAATTVCKSGAGVLRSINVNTKGITSTATVYDNTAGSGTVLAVIDTTLGENIIYDIAFTTGLTVVTGGGSPADLTVSTI